MNREYKLDPCCVHLSDAIDGMADQFTVNRDMRTVNPQKKQDGVSKAVTTIETNEAISSLKFRH